ncbi:hypothetical protein R1sor_009095 [Riccia sorocarpa]|uniref:Uncharacterized protein n=1 Tax=Riccia sorocarpa TaxID=122646 RepID=A0ABD3H6S3_9MARC
MMKQNSIRPGAPVAPSSAPQQSVQGPSGSPSHSQMDYRAAVSPARMAGGHGAAMNGDSEQFGSLVVRRTSKTMLSTARSDGPGWGAFEHHTSGPAEKGTTTGPDSNLASTGIRNGDPTAPLPVIPEQLDTGPETEEVNQDYQEPSYTDCHKAWINVLDENLAATRINPANKEASTDFEVDMSDLMNAVYDVIETSGRWGNTDRQFLSRYQTFYRRDPPAAETFTDHTHSRLTCHDFMFRKMVRSNATPTPWGQDS